MSEEGELSLGDYLRAARTKAGLSIRDLERVTGIANGYITKLERGQKTNPSAEVLLKLAEALELDASTLLAYIGMKSESLLPSPRVFFRSTYRLSDRETDEVLDMLTRYMEEKHKGGEHDEE